ncbi:MAG: arginine--tRNA ligase [Patescibacteria group bacterium]
MNLLVNFQKRIDAAIVELWPHVRGQLRAAEITYPPDEKFGHYATNVAMQLAPIVHANPIEIAQRITEKLGAVPAAARVEVVQPGFINFFVDEAWLVRQVRLIITEKRRFGASAVGKGIRVQVEFISANPTGPLHIGNGRGGFAGDTLANVLKLTGHTVQREYYVNDMGKQVGILAESVLRRYWQHKGIKSEYPEYCYQGAYVDDLAKKLFLPNYKLNNTQKLEEVREKIKGRILQRMITSIKKFCEKELRIKFDTWFSERELYDSGQVDMVLAALKERQLLYRSEGALWLRTKRFGDDKDRVLIKADGEPVYFLSDVAYHWNKFAKRKFDKVIDVLGADHHGYIGRLQAVMRIFEFDAKLDVLITQLVRLIRDGEELKMSKRAGTFVLLEELVREVGIDAVRYFYLMHDFGTHMDFDLDLAKKQSKDNPVYYVQYAHARICSILSKAKGLKTAPPQRGSAVEPPEAALIRLLIRWPELLVEVSRTYQVSKLPSYAAQLAMQFHDFYTRCRVIDHNIVDERRLNVIKATRIVLQNALSAMGISAPDKM